MLTTDETIPATAAAVNQNLAETSSDTEIVLPKDRTAMPRTFMVLDEHMTTLRKQLATWERKAKKLETFGMKVVIGEKSFVEVEMSWEVETDFGPIVRSKKVKRTAWPVTIEGEIPSLDGWSFAATLVPLTAGNVIQSLWGAEVPGTYHDTGTRCDHCNTSRRRSETFVVKHEDGRFMQVGRSCLKDFLPNKDAEQVLCVLESLRTLCIGGAGEESYWMRGRPSEHDMIDWLSHVALEIRKHGYISKASMRGYSAQEGVRCTADCASHNMNCRESQDPKVRRDYEEPTDADVDMAIRAQEHWKAVSPRNDFERDMHIIAQEAAIPYRLEGKAAYLVEGFRRTLQAAKPAVKAPAQSEYLGKVGERLDLLLTVTKTIGTNSAYGTVVTKCRDEKGNVVTWFTTKEMEEGRDYLVRATVKAHNEYRGVRETVITRGTIVEDIDGDRIAKAVAERKEARAVEAAAKEEAARAEYEAKRAAETKATVDSVLAEMEAETQAWIAAAVSGVTEVPDVDGETRVFVRTVRNVSVSDRALYALIVLRGVNGVEYTRRFLVYGNACTVTEAKSVDIEPSAS